jgi:hypothetical protein
MVIPFGTLENAKTVIVNWLLERSPKEHWRQHGMDSLLYAPAWHVEEYGEEDYADDGDKNFRIYAIKDASVDGVLSGRVRVVSDHSDEQILSIEPYSANFELSYHQKRFFELCKASEPVEAVKSDNPEFGSW